MKKIANFYNYIKIRKILASAIILSICIEFTSCVKQTSLFSPQEGEVYMPQAYSDRANLTMFKIDSPQIVTFGIARGGFNSATTDITGTFLVDTSLIAKYNQDNAYLGNHYVALPDSVYTIPSLSAVIKAGKTSSDPLSIVVKANKLPRGLKYLLPVRLTNVSSGKLDSSLTVAYFKIDSVYTRSLDLTSLASITVSNDNNGGPDAGEGSKKLIDGLLSTKFLSFNYNTNFWAMLKLSSPKKLNAYTLTSGNDASERDPKNWMFQASDDGTNWTTLDTRNNVVFPLRSQTQTFELNSPDNKEHSYYRLLISSINGSGSLIQITEWRLLQYY